MAAVMSNGMHTRLETGLFYVLLFSDFAHSLGGGWGRNEHYLVTKVRKGSRRGDGAGRPLPEALCPGSSPVIGNSAVHSMVTVW